MTQKIQEIHLKEGEIIEITPDMIIGDVLAAYPEIKPVFDKAGIHCASCYAAMNDSIAEGAYLHNLNPEELCKLINKTIRSRRNT